MEDTDKNRVYVAIDLKSFYASVECVKRGLDPLTTNLVVADISRTEKTICLAVSPSLKAYGISGRARLFEVVQKVKHINADRLKKAPGKTFSGSSTNDTEVRADPSLSLDYITATPRMAEYMKVSSEIYNVYLKYVAPEDMHVYSVDEVFIDATSYLEMYSLTPREFTVKLIKAVLRETGITATAGIGTNLYLCKIAMDIEAKHIKPDADGVRIAELDEMSYRENLWDHRPLTDFWRVGPGYAKKLEQHGMFTMGDVAECSLGKQNEYRNEDLLYRLFGVNAELLIDHAWGWEPCTIADIKAYRPENRSLSSGQVLQYPYEWEKAKLVVKEMADMMAMDLVEKKLLTDQIVLTVCYDTENLTDPKRAAEYKGQVKTDRYGRKTPKEAHGSINLEKYTSSAKLITRKTAELFDSISDSSLLIRRLYLDANHLISDSEMHEDENYEQLSIFQNTDEEGSNKEEKEKKEQEAILAIRRKYGKNAILKGMSLQEGATARDRNRQIGGHKA